MLSCLVLLLTNIIFMPAPISSVVGCRCLPGRLLMHDLWLILVLHRAVTLLMLRWLCMRWRCMRWLCMGWLCMPWMLQEVRLSSRCSCRLTAVTTVPWVLGHSIGCPCYVASLMHGRVAVSISML